MPFRAARWQDIWVIAGLFNVFGGITTIRRGDYLTNFSSQTPGRILLIFGIVQLVAGFMGVSDNTTGNLLGVSAASRDLQGAPGR